MRFNPDFGYHRLYSGVLLALAFVLSLFIIDRAAVAAIAVSKSVAPTFSGTILPGDASAFRITLTNDNPASAVNNAAFTDDMTAVGITVFDAGGGTGVVSNTCGGTVTATPGAPTISLANGVIPIAPGGGVLGSCDIIVQVTSTAAGTAPVNTISIGAVTGNDGAAQTNATQAQQNITVLSLAPPTLAKSFNPTSVVQNDQSSVLQLVINNPNGTANLPLTTVTDSLPAGMQVAAVPNASITCTGTGASNGTFTPNASDTTLTITGGAVGQSGSCTISVNVIGTTAGATGSQTLTNTLLGSNVGNTRGLTPANASATLAVNSPLRVAKAFAPNPVRAGQQATLTIQLFNDSPTTALNLTTFTDDPIGDVAGLTVTAAPSTTCSGATVAATGGNTGITLTGGSIAANTNCTITVPFTGTLAVPGAPHTFTNVVPAGAVGNTNGVTSRPVNATVTVNDQLTASKSVSPTTIAPGNLVTYTVAVNNFTGGALSGVSFPDSLPNGIAAVTSPAPTVSAGCGNFSSNLSTATTPVFTFDMPAGSGGSPGTCTVTFHAQVPTGAATAFNFDNVLPANTVKTAGVCGAGAICNAAASNTARTTTIATTQLAKAFNPNTLSEGGVSQLTITFSNNSATALTNLDLTDALPSAGGGQVIIANPAGATTSCTGSPTVTANPGDSSVRIQNASIPARAGGGTGAAGTCFLRVNVTGPAGNYTNTIPANTFDATETLPDNSTRPVAFPTATAPLTFSPALTASKSFAPSTIQAGGKSRLAIRLNNTGTGTLNNVSVNDPLPADMTIANPANASTTCTGAPIISAAPGANAFTLTGSILPAGGTCEVLVDVTASSGANSVNSIPIGNVTADGGVRNTSPITATLQKSAGGLTVTKSINPNTITAPGQVSTVTLTLLNTGGIALTNVGLTDFFTNTGLVGGTPTGMRIAATPNASTSCPGGFVTAVTNATSISLGGASIAASGSAGDTCQIQVDVTTFSVGTVQNTIPVNAVSTTQGITNSLAAVSSLATLARLGVQKSFIPPTISPGQRSRLRLRFINPLALPLTGLSVTDNLPAGLVVPAGANPTTTCVGGSVTSPINTRVVVSGGTLTAAPSGSTTTCDAEIDVFAAAPGPYVNVIAAGTVNALAGGQPVTNQPPDVTATLQVRNPAAIAKTFSPSPVAPGVSSTLTITVTNPNGIPLTAAHFTDPLPSGLAVALTPNASTTCGGVVSAAPSATQVSLTGGTVPANGSCVVVINTLSNTPGTYTNTIPPNALTTAEGVTNDEPATGAVVVSNPPTIAKSFTPVSIPSGGASVLSVVLGNVNNAPITLTAALSDTLPTAPGPLVIASPNGLSGTCTLASVTATAGTGVISYASGAQIPAGGCTINVNVTGTVNGTYNNTIPANALQTNVGNNLQPAISDLVISPLGFISGRVFKDNNVTPNGTFDSGTDTPLSNVTVTLTGTDFGPDGIAGGGDDTPVTHTVITDALGNYAFTSLNAGSYSVTEPTQPSGTLNGITTAGTINGAGGGTAGTATAVGTTPSAIANITLKRTGGGQVDSSPNNDFAEVATSSISGTVFLDQNNNGVQNGADSPLANVTVQLLDAGGAVVATTTTDASGSYTFGNLAPGTYSVREPTQPPSTSSGLTIPGAVPNGGTPGTSTPPNNTPSRINNIVLPPNTQSTGNNFAELPNGRTVSGRVFIDFDNNGAVNGNDHGLSGQTLNLTGTDINGNPVHATTTTAADGSYAFTGLAEGTYTVAQAAQPAGTNSGITTPGSTGGVATPPAIVASSISAINLTGANTLSADNNFGEILANATDLTITKTNSPAQFAAGSNLNRYQLTVSNIGTVASGGVITVTDTMPGGMTAVAAPSDAPWACTVSAGGSVVTCTTSSVVGPSASLPPINLRVAIAPGLQGESLINVARVGGGGETPGFDGNNSASDPTQLQQGASISGTVWFESKSSDDIKEADEPGLPGWIVELVRGGVVVATTTTDANGNYTFSGVPPTTGGETYEIQFRNPVSHALFGDPISNEPGVDLSRHTIAHLTVAPGANITAQNLPLDPSGIVYDAVTRKPVAGATVTLVGPPGFDPAQHLLGGTGNSTQVTDSTGFYQYLLLPGAPAGTYTVKVTPPGGYLPTPSSLLPPQAGALSVGPLPNPFLISPSAVPPPPGDNNARYFFSFNFNSGSASVIHNHIPLDPVLSGALTITKSTPLVNVARGDLVPYTITARNNLASNLLSIDLRDQVPAGFKYRIGSSRINGIPLEPRVEGRNLSWTNQNFAPNEIKTIKIILVVGTGVGEGEYINQALGLSSVTGSPVSNVATASVRVVPDPTFDCSDVIGKVFDDKNANGYQDDGERGIPNVRLATVNGLLVTTDSEGRFHVACAAVPQEDHGSNFVMKVDTRTLPTGYRVTTENPRDVRLTRGKMTKINFGATLHQVVRIELSDAAFDGDALKSEFVTQIEKLLTSIKEHPSVIRLTYRGRETKDDLAQKHTEAVRKDIQHRWEAAHCCYPLVVEVEGKGVLP